MNNTHKKNSKRTGTTSSRTPSAERAIDGLGETLPSQPPELSEEYIGARYAEIMSQTEKKRPTTSGPLSTLLLALGDGTPTVHASSEDPELSKYFAQLATPSRPEPRMSREKQLEQSEEDVAHQRHYESLKIQPIDYITQNALGYMEGNIVKYISRFKMKGGKRDLLKAQEYLARLIKETP